MEIKLEGKCNCGKEVNVNEELPENFRYVGCDEETNPVFQCKDCGVYVYG